METLFVGLSFLLGAVLASFAGVLACRMYTGQSFVGGSSRCDRCGRALGAASLIPILSYVACGGRARCCGAHIPLSAPLSELVMGALCALAYLRLGFTLALLLMIVTLTLLAALVLYDLAHQILPPPLLALFVAFALAFAYATSPTLSALEVSGIYAIAFAAFFALLWLASGGRAMGLADSPLVFGLALCAGSYALMGFLLSFWTGALVGIVLLAWPRAGATMKSEVPFAPFLALGFLLAYFTQWDPFSITAALSSLL